MAVGPHKNTAPHGDCAPRVVSLGCRLNIAEGEEIGRLAGAASIGPAVIINSCAVTNEAVRSTRQTIRRARRDNPTARIIVTGCAAQIDPVAFSAMPEVDAVIGNDEKLQSSEWALLRDGGEPMRVNDIMAVRENAAHLIDGYGDRARAFLQVQNGCNHRCTFCVIPFGRGPSRSVSIADAVTAAQRLVDSGHKEIVLTGVDMTSWGEDLAGAPKLGRLVSAILDGAPDLFRLRLSSIDCAEIDDELFARITGDDRVAPYVHLSLQAGSDMILKRMKRRHLRDTAIELAGRLRERRPEIALGADLIAGFPTETEQMFAETLDLIEAARIDFAHIFPYSARAGTPAARMPQLNGSVVADRARRLREKARSALESFLETLVGTSETAVVESGGRARLGNFAAVDINGSKAEAGNLAKVLVTARSGDRLTGDLIS